VRVSDSGQGIDPVFLPHVFDRFRQEDSATTRSVGGLGLGLFIARQLVEAQNGTLRAESDGPNRGASFTVTLPAAPAASRPAAGRPDALQSSDASRAPVLDGVCVLLVDDEADAREMMATALENLRRQGRFRGVRTRRAAGAGPGSGRRLAGRHRDARTGRIRIDPRDSFSAH
jgi:hypothetical protein